MPALNTLQSDFAMAQLALWDGLGAIASWCGLGNIAGWPWQSQDCLQLALNTFLTFQFHDFFSEILQIFFFPLSYLLFPFFKNRASQNPLLLKRVDPSMGPLPSREGDYRIPSPWTPWTRYPPRAHSSPDPLFPRSLVPQLSYALHSIHSQYPS